MVRLLLFKTHETKLWLIVCGPSSGCPIVTKAELNFTLHWFLKKYNILCELLWSWLLGKSSSVMLMRNSSSQRLLKTISLWSIIMELVSMKHDTRFSPLLSGLSSVSPLWNQDPLLYFCLPLWCIMCKHWPLSLPSCVEGTLTRQISDQH